MHYTMASKCCSKCHSRIFFSKIGIFMPYGWDGNSHYTKPSRPDRIAIPNLGKNISGNSTLIDSLIELHELYYFFYFLFFLVCFREIFTVRSASRKAMINLTLKITPHRYTNVLHDLKLQQTHTQFCHFVSSSL